MDHFVLHERLEADTATIADWPLCRVLLMNDARYPWLILVPRRTGLIEWHDLNPADLAVLAGEVGRASGGLKAVTGAGKINIGALGNLVPQLHIHVVARNLGDAAWPGPVWGHGRSEPYELGARRKLVEALAHL